MAPYTSNHKAGKKSPKLSGVETSDLTSKPAFLKRERFLQGWMNLFQVEN